MTYNVTGAKLQTVHVEVYVFRVTTLPPKNINGRAAAKNDDSHCVPM